MREHIECLVEIYPLIEGTKKKLEKTELVDEDKKVVLKITFC